MPTLDSCVFIGSAKLSHRVSPMQDDEMLTIKDVVALLKVREKIIYSMVQGRELLAFKVRGQWRFSRKDLDVWIQQQKYSTQDVEEDQKK